MAENKWIGGTLSIGTGQLKDSNWSTDASHKLGVDKQKHLFKAGTNFGDAVGDAPTTKEEIVIVASVAGTIRGFHVYPKVTGTSTSVTFDLKVNGTTVLSSVVTVTNADADGVTLDGTVNNASYSADDVITIARTMSSNTGASGFVAWAELEEAAQ